MDAIQRDGWSSPGGLDLIVRLWRRRVCVKNGAPAADRRQLPIVSSAPQSSARRSRIITTVDRPIRVIQWTTGNIGRRSLHAIIGRGDMELVGVYAYGADKVGVDAAELAGWPEPTGVKSTNDVDELIALKPEPAATTRCGPTSTS